MEYERVQMGAIGPTPYIGYISATMNRPKLCRSSPYNGAHIATKKDRGIHEKSENRGREEKKRSQKPSRQIDVSFSAASV